MEEEKREEEKNMENEIKTVPNKESKKQNMAIIILGVVVCLLIGYIAYDKFIVKEHTSTKNEEVKKEVTKEEETKEEIKKEDVVKTLTEADIQVYKPIINLFNENFSTKYPLKVESLTNQEILYSARLEVNGHKTTTVSKDDLHNMITKIYGVDLKYIDEDIICTDSNDGVLFEYNNDQYSFYGNHGHDVCRVVVQNYFLDAKSTNDTIEIRTKNVYDGVECSTYGPMERFYKDALRKELLYAQSGDIENYLSFDDVYELKKDEIPITTFILKKQSDNNFALSEIQVA